jgi:hypothetical protein
VSKRKTWLMVKRGLVTDPVHRERMGICVWLYLYMLDRAEWETGIIPDWQDVSEAEATEMSLPTIRTQRRALEQHGYITCRRSQYGQKITILRWINPRTPSGEMLNAQSDHNRSLQSDHNRSLQSDHNRSLSEVQSDQLSTLRVITFRSPGLGKPITLPIRSESNKRDHKREGADAPAPPRKKIAELMDHPAVIAYRNECLNTPNLEARKAIAQAVTDVAKWTETIQTFRVNRWNTHNIVNLIDAYQKGNEHDSNRRTNKQSPRPVTGSSVSDHQRADALALLGD